MTPTRRLLASLAAAAALCAPAARAHAILVESTPAARATVAPGAEAVAMRFNSRIDRARSRLTLVGADRSETRLPLTASTAADQMVSSMEVAPGDYTLRWQVLAVDGHITRGDVPFTVSAP